MACFHFLDRWTLVVVTTRLGFCVNDKYVGCNAISRQ